MSYSSEVLADSPWGYYLLNETSGTSFADTSGGGRTLTLTGALSAYAVTGPGGTLKGCTFPAATTTYMQTAGNATIGAAGATAEAWVFLTANPAANVVAAGLATAATPTGTGSDKVIALGVNSSGQAFGEMHNGSATVITSPDALSLNAWHHLVLTCSAANGMNLRVDKVDKVGATALWVNTVTARPFFVHGGYSSGAGALTVALPAYYPAPLTAARTDAHYDQIFDLSSTGVTFFGVLPINAGLLVSWAPVIGATSYDYRINGGAPVNVAADPGKWNVQQARITGLTNATNYTVEVRPKNGISTGVYTTLTGGGTPSASGASDAFTRVDSAVSIGSPATGGPYSLTAGVAGISTNRGYFPTIVNATPGSVLLFPAAVDVDVSLKLDTSGSSTNSFGLVFRYADSSNWWCFEYSSNGYRLLHLANTVAVGTVAFTAGDVIRVLAVGRTILCFVNGQSMLETEDSFVHLAGPMAGVRSHNINHRFDNLAATEGQLATATGRIYKGRDTQTLDLAGVA